MNTYQDPSLHHWSDFTWRGNSFTVTRDKVTFSGEPFDGEAVGFSVEGKHDTVLFQVADTETNAAGAIVAWHMRSSSGSSPFFGVVLGR